MSNLTKLFVGADGKVGLDRRSQVRQRTLKGAIVIFNRRYSTFECIVRNQSNQGARLALEQTQALPSRFELAIMDDPARDVEVCWRSTSAVGVRYA